MPLDALDEKMRLITIAGSMQGKTPLQNFPWWPGSFSQLNCKPLSWSCYASPADLLVLWQSLNMLWCASTSWVVANLQWPYSLAPMMTDSGTALHSKNWCTCHQEPVVICMITEPQIKKVVHEKTCRCWNLSVWFHIPQWPRPFYYCGCS